MVQYLNNNSGFNQWNSMQAQRKSSRFSGLFWWGVLFLLAFWIMGGWIKPQNTEVSMNNPIIMEQSNVAMQTMAGEDISFDVGGLRISNIELKKHKLESKSDTLLPLVNAPDPLLLG